MTAPARLPYPGLRAFTRDESDLFFGRDGCVDAMVDRLAATRFLAVLGASGSGKSSLVRTGLLDALSLGLHPWAGTRWTVADLHPAGQPIRNLAAALLTSQSGGSPDVTSIDLLAEFLRRGPRSVAEWCAGRDFEQGSNLLILVDQFEELFRYGNYARQEEAEAFVALLLETAATDGVNIHIVITMRSEYLGACALMPGLAERINAGLYLTPRMSREECRAAIEGPAAVTGFTVEAPLVNRLLNDLASFAPWEAGDAADQAERLARRADQLPLMQHVLNRLWAHAVEHTGSTGVVLRLGDYDGLGGLSGALDVHGKELLAGLGEARAPSVRMVFESLVSGSTVADAIRRPCRLSELVDVTGSRDDVVAIVEAFSADDCNFLRVSQPSLTSADTIVDISHESLIRQWLPLRQWLTNEARNGAAWRRLLEAEERCANGEGSPLTGLDLGGLAAWWESAAPTPVWARRHGGNFEAVQAFLEMSRQAEAEHVEADRQRQIRERKRLQFGLAALAVALALALGFGILAQLQRRTLEATNTRLGDMNGALEEQSRKASAAETQALQQRDQANSARDEADSARVEAEAARQRAEMMARQNRQQGNQLAQVRNARTLEEAQRVVNNKGDTSSLPEANQDRSGVGSGSALAAPLIGTATGAARPRITAEGSQQADVAAARRKFLQDPTAVNLIALETAVDRLAQEHDKANRQRDAVALYQELRDDAEGLVTQKPDMPAYRAAWSILISYGDRLKATDRVKARPVFERSLQLAELLSDSRDDLYRRLVTYERIGDQESADEQFESAAAWFTKETALARGRFAQDKTTANLTTMRYASERLWKALVKLERPAEADPVLSELVAAAEQLIALAPDSASHRVAWSILITRGDSLKARDRAAARQPFGRSAELADLLSYKGEDLHRRLVSYERLGDLDVADNKLDAANLWFTREVQAARAKYEDATAENLGSLKIAMDRLYQNLVALRQSNDARAVQRELVEAADALVKSSPGAAAYALAWDILTDQGNRLQQTDRAAARRAFVLSAEMADRLPGDKAPDLHKRLYSYERIGAQDAADNKLEPAGEWYAREFDTARRRYGLEPTAETLKSMRLAATRLDGIYAKLQRPSQSATLPAALADAAESLLKRTTADSAVQEVVLVYLDSARQALRSGDRVQAQRYMTRSNALFEQLKSATADSAYSRYQVLDGIADSYREAGSPAESRAASLEAGTSLENYLVTFRLASPPGRATADTRTIANIYGSLSFDYLLGGNFPKSIEAARHGLEIEPDAGWIEANLAHGLLLTGKETEAVARYMKVRTGMLNQRTLVDATAEDFAILKTLGFEHPLMDTIVKQMAQK